MHMVCITLLKLIAVKNQFIFGEFLLQFRTFIKGIILNRQLNAEQHKFRCRRIHARELSNQVWH